VTAAGHIIGGLLRLLVSILRVLALLAVHHPRAALVLLLVLILAVLFHRRVLGRRAQARHRTRALRWRVRLRLRPGPGYASLAEVWLRWGRLAALHHGRRARPGLRLSARLFLPVTAYAVRLGRAQYARRCLARMEDQQLILAPQRTGKSGIIADRLLDHPGPAIVTSTRPDLYHLTAGARSHRGPLYVFNPQHAGALPSTFSWDILAPCRDLVMARRMAGWLTGAIASQDANHGNLEWFEKAGDAAMMGLLHAAALGGHTITDVYAWTQLQRQDVPLRVLASRPGNELLVAAVKRALDAGSKTAASIRETISLSLAWATIPQLAAAVTPRPGEDFDLAEFIADNGTLYLIASGDEDSPVAPVFRALTSWIHWHAGLIGSAAPAGRLDPPLWLGLDEVTTICPVDLPTMLSDSAGKGVLITAVAHGTSQLEERWGPAGAKTVWACCGTKVILGGVSDAGTLEELSRLCGTIAIGEDDSKTVSVVPPELVRMLPDWRALVIRMNLNPVIVKFRPAWKRTGYRFSRRIPVYIPRPAQPAAAGTVREPAELEPALTEADLARFFDQAPADDTSARTAFPLPSGPDPQTFKPGKASS
jgi:type IV secretion system protein VirD4